MLRKVIDYLRKKQNITIEDLVVEICSSTMYYKYLAGTKNLSEKNLDLIKDRLGADKLTKEEIQAFKKDLNKITLNIMKFYGSKNSFEKDIEPLIEIENQLILNEELIIPYLIVKINYLLGCSDTKEVDDLIELLKVFEPKMSIVEKLMCYRFRILLNEFKDNEIENYLLPYIQLLEHNIYNKDFGTFVLSATLYYMRLRNRIGAFRMVEKAIELFQRDINIIGIVKATNTKGMLLITEGKYQEALDILILNYDNCKKINAEYETLSCLANIIECSLETSNKDISDKYFSIFLKKLNKITDIELVKTILNHISVGLITTFDYYKKYDEINVLRDLIKKYQCFENIVVKKLYEYYELRSMDEIVEYATSELLPNIVGKAHFAYCRWLIDKCVLYYRNNRMYKKAADIEIEYVKVFQKYYYF